ncbi:hypothetical protein F0562_008225 [Nyssa sinensis]|uniref:Uncharacterized protein n=1 Tax=Nyssa sinensis TaxID=561372 RepID=A0A5J5A9K2_9ASTE|nr:hypothetical protein F0562_008225 [Nyssa sinensis]
MKMHGWHLPPAKHISSIQDKQHKVGAVDSFPYVPLDMINIAGRHMNGNYSKLPARLPVRMEPMDNIGLVPKQRISKEQGSKPATVTYNSTSRWRSACYR